MIQSLSFEDPHRDTPTLSIQLTPPPQSKFLHYLAHIAEYRALERVIALAERLIATGREPNYTVDPATGRGLSVEELAVTLRCSHQWAFVDCFLQCAERIQDLLEEKRGACIGVNFDDQADGYSSHTPQPIQTTHPRHQTDPQDAAAAINELPHTVYEEELVLNILMQSGVIVFRAAEANGAYFEQHVWQTWPPSSSSCSSLSNSGPKKRRRSDEGAQQPRRPRRVMPKWDLLKVVSPNIHVRTHE